MPARKIIAGNWKMNCSITTFEYVRNLREEQFAGLDAFIALPDVYVSHARDVFPGFISLGAQDISRYEEGAYTGEVSARMLRECGVSHVIIGHSERRTLFNEDNRTVSEKLSRCLGNSLRPVLCIGESANCRKGGNYIDFLHNQLRESLGEHKNIGIDVAYEPVWAIGGGRSAGPEEIAEVVEHVHSWMAQYGLRGGILYGGSASSESIDEIIGIRFVDGVLVGNASLTDEFGMIAEKISTTASAREINTK